MPARSPWPARISRAARWAALALWAAALFLWAVSRWWFANIAVDCGTVRVTCSVINGAAAIQWWSTPIGPHWTGWFVSIDRSGRLVPAARWAENWTPTYEPWTSGDGQIFIPHWLTAALLLAPALPFWWFRSRERAGHCAKCGYDLKGLPGGAVCPECGTSASADRPRADPAA